jgi:uncharacterized protein involved in exopolysaccharide biosynthesis
MEDFPTEEHEIGTGRSAQRGERVVYVMPGSPGIQAGNDSIDLARIWNVLWANKWIVVAVTAIFAVASIVYALTLTHWYRSEVLLAPADEQVMNTGVMGQLGSLAGLAGISVGGGGSAEALAVLSSRDFTRAFVEEQNLVPILFADKWDAENETWLDEDPERWPDVEDAVVYFGNSLRAISEDRQTGLVTVAVEWTDPDLAAQWVTLLVERLNDYTRAQALKEAQANIEYLQAELAATSTFALQQAIGNLLEREHQKLMLARGNDEFSFRVIDSAIVPDSPSRPNRRLMVIVATLFGGLIAVFLVLARQFVRDRDGRDYAASEN